MDIALVHHFDPQKAYIWGTPEGVGFELRKRGMGLDLYPINPTACSFKELIYNVNKYDAVLVFYAGPSPSLDLELERLKSPARQCKVPVLLELGDEPQTMHDNRYRINSADAVFTPDIRCHKKYLAEGYNSHYLTHWCDDYIFYYNEHFPRSHKCVTTCGNRWMTGALSNEFGDKFVNARVKHGLNTFFYNSGTIVFQYARYDEITRRIFEGGGCHNAVITNRISPESEISSLFVENEDIVYYDSYQDCVSKLRAMLKDREYTNYLADNIYRKIRNSHLVSHRVDQLIDIVISQSIS